jgi:hypothetical protein
VAAVRPNGPRVHSDGVTRRQRSLMVAAIAAAAAVAAAWLSAGPGGPNTDNQAGPQADEVIGVVITHVSVSSVIAGRITLDVTGAARGLSVDDEIYAIARRKGDQAPTEPSGEPQTWLVAQADREPGGGWTAHIVVPYEQRRAFTVVAVVLEGCPPGAPSSPRPPEEARRDTLGKLGPAYGDAASAPAEVAPGFHIGG